MKKKVVAVYWRDPTIYAGWQHDEDHDAETDLPLFVTYGILVGTNNGIVSVAGTVHPETDRDRYADITKYPKGCIDHIDVIGTLDVKARKR